MWRLQGSRLQGACKEPASKLPVAIVAQAIQVFIAARTLTMQALPQHLKECLFCNEKLGQEASRRDPLGWEATTAAVAAGRAGDADVFHDLLMKLRIGLNTWRKPGTAGSVANVLGWCTGSRMAQDGGRVSCTSQNDGRSSLCMCIHSKCVRWPKSD